MALRVFSGVFAAVAAESLSADDLEAIKYWEESEPIFAESELDIHVSDEDFEDGGLSHALHHGMDHIKEGAASLRRSASKLFPRATQRWIMPDTDPLIASDRANATFDREEPLHACLFSDRMAATPLVIQSVAEHASRPDLIHIWVVTPKESYEEFKRLAVPNTFKNGIHVHVMALEDITAELVNHKYKPVWTWKEFGSSLHNPEWLTKPMSTEPLRADVDPKHMHPMNHLRFYLPYMDVFKDAKRLVLLDDDVVLQGDLNDLVSLPFPQDKVIITNCRRWKHHNGTFAYEIPFKGDAANVLLGRVEHATRKQMAQHWKNLNAIASQINGHEVSLHNETYFNFGVSLLNLDEWKRLDLTGIYHKWMRANYREHIFREDTLAYFIVYKHSKRCLI